MCNIKNRRMYNIGKGNKIWNTVNGDKLAKWYYVSAIMLERVFVG